MAAKKTDLLLWYTFKVHPWGQNGHAEQTDNAEIL
jgi:hypothetical protein